MDRSVTQPALPDGDLERARHNLQRVCDFLAIHTAPPAAGGGRPEVSRLFDAAVGLCQRLQPVLEANGVSPPRPLPAVAEAAGGRPLDATRAGRFSDFIAQLEQWFAVQAGLTASTQGVAAVRAMYASLITIRSATSVLLDQIDAAPPAAPDETASAGGEHDVPAASGSAEIPAAPPPPPLPLAQPRSNRKLLLVDLDERPLLAQFQGANELTETAVTSLTEFLDEHGIELSSYDRRRLDDKVRRWIEATPDGQALVLKVGGLRGSLEPFPSYVPRETVKAEIEVLRGYA